MQETPPDRTAPDSVRLPTDRRTLACVALGGALAAVAVTKLSHSSTWRALEFDVRIAGLTLVSLITGALFALRDVLGDRWFGFLVFGVLAGFASVGVYGLVSLLGMPPSAGVRFLVAAPLVAALGTAAGAAIVRRVRR
ncbi:hypothetical protein AXK57_20920 [Tsukamurella pulmonis]|uniref:Fluoride ion transporter CrcB n=1 Tax=Tsukamurella pulmonis TaxID=47312 RepID=A0A1H1HWV8_9ACTN|nr:hypothetical protein [Tsukamurella pulmonis]KXO94322.1 hypothetical protein AXK56_16775 [Tsukamurella pulmonis]KXP11721.1 hypothetical protein AXK57_20920 [Tsukamurella pulmonis]RDH12918.1 hypothetical protein DVB88_05085 [Tsukamurella pulmonis]SDR29576.1 hypothetical protein SAMN04489765_4652 [Tsukamurella pulmonis]SUP12951.1 Uncharacterised protein [Tsukamurella pulmonis]